MLKVAYKHAADRDFVEFVWLKHIQLDFGLQCLTVVLHQPAWLIAELWQASKMPHMPLEP